MATPKLRGPYMLESGVIRSVVPPKVAGAYVVGAINPGGLGQIEAVGRADRDLAATLTSLIGVDSGFMFATASSAAEAFGMECALYHEHKLAGRRAHPVAPADSPGRCPICEKAG